MTEERRSQRAAKYAEADPDGRFQADYSHLVRPPMGVVSWRPRPPHLPLLANGRSVWPVEEGTRPAMSAVIIARDDEAVIGRAVSAAVDQDVPGGHEVIVVTSGTDRTADVVRATFPGVTVVELPQPALPGEARNAGMAVATGEYVTFPGSHVDLCRDALAARLRAHRVGYAMVTTVVRNGVPTPAGWANYFLDHSANLAGRPSQELREPPNHCSYRRDVLEWFGPFPEAVRSGEDTAVNAGLFALGYGAYFVQAEGFVHRSPCTTPWRLVRHHARRGRGLGVILRAGGVRADALGGNAYIGPRGAAGRLLRIRGRCRRWAPDLAAEYRSARVLIAAAVAAYCIAAQVERRSARRQ
jgi:hypothetical protein